MSYLINIAFGNVRTVKRFRFESESETSDEDFDKAVKSINKKYKDNGRFMSQSEVIDHFKKFGFYRLPI